MKKQTLCFGLSIAVILTTAAFAGDNSGNNSSLSKSEAAFVQMAAQNAMTEAHLGQMAQEQSSNPNVKQFGQKLIDEHKGAYQELSSLASQWNITIPQSIDQKHRKAINNLSTLTGTQFDNQFLRQEVSDHEKAIAAFRQQADHGQNAQVKDYASKMLPKLEEHLAMARNLLSNPGQNMSSTSQNMNPSTSADRTNNGTEAGAAAAAPEKPQAAGTNSSTVYATVVSYEPGKVLKLKMRRRGGVHTYDLSGDKVAANIDSAVSNGTQVKVTEEMDVNGRRTITVVPSTGQDTRSEQH